MIDLGHPRNAEIRVTTYQLHGYSMGIPRYLRQYAIERPDAMRGFITWTTWEIERDERKISAREHRSR